MSAILMFEKKDDEGVVLETVYFTGYKRLPQTPNGFPGATDGPLFSYERQSAYLFDTKGHAENVRNGDERIQAFKAVDV